MLHVSERKLNLLSSLAQRSRVPCPVDPTHTVCASQLAVHVKVCTRARETASIQAAPYVCKACNCGSDDEDDTVSDVATLWRLLPNDMAFETALVEVRCVT
jgi:U11-48K-like CHHC zinc finger